MANIGIYTKDVRMIKIHESAVNLCVENASTLKVADKKNYPCFCTWADGKRGAIATDSSKTSCLQKQACLCMSLPKEN